MKEAVQTVVFNPASALVVAVAAALMARYQTPFAWVINPWDFNLLWWLAGYVFVRVSLLGFVDGLAMKVAPMLPPLPSRTGPKPVFQHNINSTDVSYLVINSTIEYVFALQISFLLWHAPFILRAR